MLFLFCFSLILYSQFLSVSTNLYNTVHYVRAIEILHFWQLLINVFLVIFDFLHILFDSYAKTGNYYKEEGSQLKRTESFGHPVVTNPSKVAVSKIYTHGCPSVCHSGPLQLWTAASACSESLYLACSGSYRPAAPQWCPSTGAPESAAAAQRCPPDKRCPLPAPDQIPRLGNVQGPRPRSARTQPLIPGSLGAGLPSRWQRGSLGQAPCQ